MAKDHQSVVEFPPWAFPFVREPWRLLFYILKVLEGKQRLFMETQWNAVSLLLLFERKTANWVAGYKEQRCLCVRLPGKEWICPLCDSGLVWTSFPFSHREEL